MSPFGNHRRGYGWMDGWMDGWNNLINRKNYSLSQAGLDRVRRDTDNEDNSINMDNMSHKDEDINMDQDDMGDKVSNLVPSAQTIATVLRSIADAADLYGS